MTVTTLDTLNVKRLPWAENMVEVNEGATVDQLLTSAGLDWQVKFSPLFRHVAEIPVQYTNPETGEVITINAVPTDPRFVSATDIKDVMKEDGKILGQVRSDYRITQNHEAFRFADNLVDDGVGRWIAAGSQYDDKVVFGVMHLRDSGIMVGGEDPIDLYLMIRTSHNGGTGIQVIVTPVRIACENMITIASKAAKFRWTIRHVSTLEGRLQEARDTLQLATKYMHDGLQVELEKLIDTTVTEERAAWLLDRVIPASRAKRDDVINGIMAATADAERNGYAGTGYGLLNGLTDFYDHNITRRTAASRLQEQVDGEGAKMRNKLVEALLKPAEALLVS